MKISETETISYEIFNSKDLDRVANAITRTFTNSDPMSTAQQLSVNELANYVKLLGEWAEKQKLTVVTKDKFTEEVAGVVLGVDFALDFLTPENSEHISNKLKPIVELLSSL